MALRAASRRLATQLRAAPVCLGTERWIQSSSATDAQGHPKPTPLPKLKDSFLDGTSSTYLEELEERYNSDPSSVDKTWASFFGSLGELMALPGLLPLQSVFSEVSYSTQQAISRPWPDLAVEKSLSLGFLMGFYPV